MSGGLCTARPAWSSARRSPPGLSCRKVGREKLARASAGFGGAALPLPAFAGGLLGASAGVAGSSEVASGWSGDLGPGGGAPPELTRCATAERTRLSMLPPGPALGRGPAPWGSRGRRSFPEPPHPLRALPSACRLRPASVALGKGPAAVARRALGEAARSQPRSGADPGRNLPIVTGAGCLLARGLPGGWRAGLVSSERSQPPRGPRGVKHWV